MRIRAANKTAILLVEEFRIACSWLPNSLHGMTLVRVRGQRHNGWLLVLGRDVARRVHRRAGRRHIVAHAAFPAQRGPRANSQDRCAARRWPAYGGDDPLE